ncbi:hypothetical protein PV735_11285 [Streptomyces turgidiscabies]|uniref:Uncharacterized protein n=1 Tax=Streptomyces turgidiscabies (strain Car8) TaxID=698760 RepID=L7ETM7_STRT8|nr:hypothetical protein [Streptomyces turgidiscabies]ELP61750.1 hypothetical protein STRTUCAR8_06435 [Streptomyces turgidiscabies Car8]MDX3493267.1 hypothetical protein [Streptomyces turgidiscabies]GAQ70567.1 hypothetical protein T45_02303 [Streptomyces turgidiscabies]
MSDSYTPLFDPARDVAFLPLPVDRELKIARALLAEVAGKNIHSKDEMIRAAVALEGRMRSLVAALDAERGEGQ